MAPLRRRAVPVVLPRRRTVARPKGEPLTMGRVEGRHEPVRWQRAPGGRTMGDLRMVRGGGRIRSIQGPAAPSRPTPASRMQAVAIALSERRRSFYGLGPRRDL